MQLNLPTKLTLARIAAIPVILLLLAFPTVWTAWLAFLLFVAAGITDWLDGYLARRWNQTSKLGQLLDPIADKLLVVAVLLMLVFSGQIGAWGMVPALAILLREIFIAGLREYLAGQQVIVPVSKLAKWKTAAQFTALAVLIVVPAIGDTAVILGHLLLWIAAVLTVKTAWDYWQANSRRLFER
jgi:CDP-diacylglycerol--glycerol-3-phosphate 3-phosphatidyltransferase